MEALWEQWEAFFSAEKTSQGWLAGFGWSPSLVIVGLSGWF